MLQLPGAPALSDFRVSGLTDELKRITPDIQTVRTHFVHFADLDEALADSEYEILTRLLTYGPEATTSGAGVDGLTRLVVPRPGTISPWSSKATDIARICGLKKVRRLERGIVYHLGLAGALSTTQLAQCDSLIHDRMTETVLSSTDEAEILFRIDAPRELQHIPLMDEGVEAIRRANDELGMALTADEIEYLVDAFESLGRDPTDVELMMFAQANSEHCRHKTFKASWELDGEPRPHSLFDMIRHTFQVTNGAGVLSAYEDNASVIKGLKGARFYANPTSREYGYHEEDIHILMKVETHNHPTAIAPFPGAATGAGGEIRDEGAVGRGSKPKAGLTGYSVSNLKIPGHEQPWEVDYGSPDRIATALEIMTRAPIGGASFNNEFGRPNIAGYFRSFEMEFDGEIRGYHKPIMIAGGLGNIRAEHVSQNPIQAGASLIVLGGPAMLIGLGGGAASSMASGSSDAELDFASVQRGNPEMQHRCQEVIDRCWQLGPENPIAFIHDVGAGGLSNALPELVHDGGVGGEFELREVPNAEPGMSPLEIWCNEAQERYVLAVTPEHLDRFVRICERERCPYAVVGTATDKGHLLVNDRQLDSRPVDLPLSVLFGKPPAMHKNAQTKTPVRHPVDTNVDLCEAVMRVIGHPTVASKSFLITIGDRTVGGLVSRDQMVGPWQTPVADVAVTTSAYTGRSGEAMAMGERTPVALLDAPASGCMAVGEAVTNIAAARIGAIEDVKLSANWMAASGHPGEDARLYRTVEAVGMELCPALGICIPVGKDSMSMQTRWQEEDREKTVTAPLSLVVSAFAPVPDVSKTLTPQLRRDESTVILLVDLSGKRRLGGSIFAQCFNQLGDECPDVDSPEHPKDFFAIIQDDTIRELVLAYHDRSDGGLLATVLEMAFASRMGVSINVSDNVIETLFNEELGALLQVKADDVDVVRSRFQASDIACEAVARPRLDQIITINEGEERLFEARRATLQKRWSETSYRIQRLRDNPACADEEFSVIDDDDDPGLSVHLTYNLDEDVSAPYIAKGERPRLAILREQGVNSQMEMAAVFHRAGFTTVDVHMSDILAGHVDLEQFKGLIACGGFSYGDVLGAGEGWAKSILFHSRARDVFESFFHRPDTFGLGVCNGCQMFATLKSLIPGAELWPRFVVNRSEQFEARFSLVQVQKSSSVMLAGMEGSRMPIAVSHGEGRAEVDPDRFDEILNSGTVALRFVDNYAHFTETYPANPNGSPGGITGLANHDGRFTIMMPHPERVFRTVQNSWHPPEWQEDSPWMRMFRNARVWVS